jgi:hypothetical protein
MESGLNMICGQTILVTYVTNFVSKEIKRKKMEVPEPTNADYVPQGGHPMKTGHNVLYSNGYVETNGAHTWMAAVVTCTHNDWERPEGVAPTNVIPQPAEGCVHLTVFPPNNVPFFQTNIPRFKEGHTEPCWKPVE